MSTPQRAAASCANFLKSGGLGQLPMPLFAPPNHHNQNYFPVLSFVPPKFRNSVIDPAFGHRRFPANVPKMFRRPHFWLASFL
jgi:hypothetical protein